MFGSSTTGQAGSSIAIVRPNGTLIEGYTYDEFGNKTQTEYDSAGNEITDSGNEIFENEVTFTSSITDTSTGLQYMNARYYEPTTGRFISQDTYTGNAYDPWTQHLYSYCGNNPTNFIDPTGHSAEDIKDQIRTLSKELGVIQTANSYYTKRCKSGELDYSMSRTYYSRIQSNRKRISDINSELYSLRVALAEERKKEEEEKSWWNEVPESGITIPSTGEVISNVGAAVFGGTFSSASNTVSNASANKNWVVDSDRYVRYIPGKGTNVPKYPRLSKGLSKASGAITIVTTGMDVANTWTENNNNTNGQRVIKTGIQVGGAALSVAAGIATFAAINAWNPVGWGAAIVAAGVAIGGAIAISTAQEATYDALDIE